MEKLGKNIKQLRIEKKLTQEQLSDNSGVSLRTIQRIENGETEAREQTLYKLTNALNVNYQDIKTSVIKKDFFPKEKTNNTFHILIWLKILAYTIIGGCLGAITGFYLVKNGELMYVFILLFATIGAVIAIQHSLKTNKS